MERSRGFTLAEVVTVMALAAVVTLGIVGFYLESQSTWIDASSQALAQRDATIIVESISNRAREASDAWVTPCGSDSLNSEAHFYAPDGSEIVRFFWSPADSLVHYAERGGPDRGPIVPTVVERFSLSYVSPLGVVLLDSLRVRDTSGQRVALSSTFGLYNKWGS